MSRVSDYLLALIRKQVDDRGVVVWYDPQTSYSAFVQQLEMANTTIIRYENGFFRVREKLEPFLEYVTEEGELKPDADQPPSLILYVPLAREESGFALIEAETAGVVLEPGAARPECNTRLGFLVEKVFENIAPAKAAHLARQADDGLLSLEELDRMAEDAGSPTTGALQVIFGKASQMDILLAFAADASLDSKIEEKNAIGELVALAEGELGIEASKEYSIPEFRTNLQRHILLGELVLSFPEDQIPEALAKVILPVTPIQRDSLKHLCQVWRNRLDFKDAYIATAWNLEKSAGLDGLPLPTEAFLTSETFPLIDRRLLKETAQRILSKDFGKAATITEKRFTSFWARESPAIQLEWRLMETATGLMRQAGRIAEALKGKWTLDEMIDAYARHGEPWMIFDRLARHLESRFARWETTGMADEGLIYKVITLCRAIYGDIVSKLAEAYSDALLKAGFRSSKAKPQVDVFRDSVQPFIEKGTKTAYLMVDALRLEMAAELIEGIGEGFEAQIDLLIGQLPGITTVGMGALLPGAEKGLSVDCDSAGLVVSIEGKPLKSRAERLAWLAEKAGAKVRTLKLNEIIRLTPKRKKEITEAGFIAVTSQEIDRLGEEGSEESEMRIFMDEVLEKLRRGIRNLASAGIEQFVIAADHGFIFAEGLELGLQMNSPGGNTVEIHARAWIGQGGTAGEGYFRVKGSDLELGGPLEFAFPKGLGTFKVKGGVGSYFHGGPSLQENLLPLCRLRFRRPSRRETTFKIKLTIAKPRITNRFFSVTLDLEAAGLFTGGEKKIRLEVISGKSEAGSAAMAAYGFEEGTKEIVIRSGQPNPVTIMLAPGQKFETITIRAVDCETQMVLETLADLPVDLAI